VILRAAEPPDYGAIAGVQRRSVEVCLRPFYDGDLIDRWLEVIDAAKFERVRATGEEIVVAVVDGSIAGFVSFHFEMAVVGMWYVDPAFLGRGVGSSLLRHAESRLLELGCSTVMAEASLFARPHFESLGWVAVEEYEKPAFGGFFQVTSMSKQLK
jgi:putative acetyltransferase